jgi:phosphoesterase RecJ-like protein
MIEPKLMGDVLEVLKEHKTFLVSSHINPDGDAIGSQLALYSLLSNLGKTVSVVNSDPVPFAYNFLPDVTALQCVSPKSSSTQCSLSAPDLQSFDVAIILDCGSLDRIGEKLVEHARSGKALINIDHHYGNKHFGTHNLVDDRACATGEIVFDLMEYSGMEISQDQAVCLYTAILTDTGCFKYSNTTARTHTITAQLIDKGVQPDRVAESVYETIPYRRAKLFSMALDTLQLSADGRIVWASVTNEMYEQTGTVSEDTEGIIEYIRSLRGVEVAIFFRELENGGTKVSLRSKRGLDVEQVAAMFGGGGHKAAAGCNIAEPLDKVIKMVLEAITNVGEPITHN